MVVPFLDSESNIQTRLIFRGARHTLYLVGENENLYSAQKAVQRLNQVAPQIKIETIPNAGHDLTFLQAEMVNRKILDFLKQS